MSTQQSAPIPPRLELIEQDGRIRAANRIIADYAMRTGKMYNALIVAIGYSADGQPVPQEVLAQMREAIRHD